MNSNISTLTRVRISLTAAFGLTLLAACDNGGAANGSASEGVSSGSPGSEVTIYSARPGDQEPTIRSASVESIECDTTPELQKTRAELSEGGFVIVEDWPVMELRFWRITISLPELEFTQRDQFRPSDVSDVFSLDKDGNVSGRHRFGIYGDDPMQYGLELDLRC